jgi:carboxy-terminal domain RNA polymerase II polypeptide A small phosphatase
MAAAARDPGGDSKPFFAAVGDGEKEGGSGNSSSPSSSAPTTNNWLALTVTKLREELKVRGLPSSGNKAALVERLQTHEARVDDAEDPSEGTKKTAGAPVPTTSRRLGRRTTRTDVPGPRRGQPKSRGRLPADGTKGELLARRSGAEAKEESGRGGTGDAAPMMTAAPYGGMTVAALRAVLRRRQLRVSGTKATLLSRLEASDAASNAGGNASRLEGGPRTEATSTPTKYPSDLIVVLDMDRCLVDSHVSYEEETSEEFIERLLDGGWEGEAWINQDVEHWRFPVVTDHVEAYVTPRPGVNEFLRNVTGRFETHVFTSSVDVYADKVLDRLDPDGALAGRWYHTHTVEFGNSRIKDLTLLFPKRVLGRVVLVDDSTFSMIMNPANGIPVPSYMGLDPHDGELEKVWHLLRELDGVPDVRPILQEKFGVAKEWESYLGMFRGEIEELLQWKERQLRELQEPEEGRAR